MSHRIPRPPGLPVLGNLTNIDMDMPTESFLLLAKKYGEIFKFKVFGTKLIMANSYELQHELSDDTRFKKVVVDALADIRLAAGDGLFTAHLEEPNWAIAHRILMPAFGPAAIHGMYGDMMDIASQLILKWERFGPAHVFNATEDFTRLAFDTISLCAMGHRLNSFYTDRTPEFVQAMGDFLRESDMRSMRPNFVNKFKSAKWHADVEKMKELCSSIVAARKSVSDSGRNDLLDRMLNGRDPKTGQGLSDENIMYQLITFLIAGHETTSGVLSFIVHALLTTPDAYAKLKAEIDTVIGERIVTLEDIPKFPYMTAVIREAMRLYPPVPARLVVPREDTTVLNGKYALKKDAWMVVQTMSVQRDPKVWGENAEEFRPERMLGDKFDQLPPDSWQPFGFGMRGCIGRPFAWQEMHLALASIFQKFDLVAAEPDSYSLTIQATLTIKAYVKVRAVPRAGRTVHAIFPSPSSTLQQARDDQMPAAVLTKTPSNKGKQPMYILYGSNTGTCESFARKIATAAPSHGFSAQMGAMDSAAPNLPNDGPVVIITASFEGEPPDNAAHFMTWLTGLQGRQLQVVKYSVFGAGNRDWGATYQKIPMLCDTIIEQRGGHRLLSRGEGDAGGATFFQEFDDYEIRLWETLVKEYGTTQFEAVGLSMKLVDAGTARASALRQNDVALGTVVKNRLLTKGGPAKRHIEFELPEDMQYQSGDYLAILPVNPDSNVRRALARFNISSEQEIVLSSGDGPTSLPVDKPINVQLLLSGYVELSQPASSSDIRILIKHASDSATKEALDRLLGSHSELVMSVRLSVLDILERHSDIAIPFPTYLQLLPSMRVRQYSISSSPLWNSRHATLTISVVQAPALSDDEQQFLGVGSNYLASLRKGDRVAISVRPSNTAFHLPADPGVPVIMFAAGSGLAPMRGFIQERAEQKKAGRETGKMLLYYGCRDPEMDYLYSDTDLKEWSELDVVEIRSAFSRKTEESFGHRYVQDRVLHDDRTDLDDLFKSGAKIYVCGSSKVAIGVKTSLIEHIRLARGCSLQEAGDAFEHMTKGRYVTDIFE